MNLEAYEVDHIRKVRELAPECMVLLKSDGSFPLKKQEKIALYGSGARNTLKGGTGSGDVNVRAFTSIEQGLERAGFAITSKAWLDAYDAERAKARRAFRAWLKEKIASEGLDRLMETLSIVMPEPDYDLPLNGEGDTAIYVLARVSGEGVDRQAVAGDMLLSKTEIRDILQLERQYDRFLLVLNVGGVVDLSPVANQVNNILLLSQPGMAVGDSFADVLLGQTYPSGKLAATWSAWSDYCREGDFGERHDTRYREGIYVGYRFFDTIGKQPRFPFGYGLSYSTFSIISGEPQLQGSVLTLPVLVQNTGKHRGKEVAQLYVSLPEGKLDQPYQCLAAFAKTSELVPGGQEILQIRFDLKELASFDAAGNCRILEAGDYILRLGNSSRDTTVVGVIRLDRTAVIEQVSAVGGHPDFQDWKPEKEGKILAEQSHAEYATVLHLSSDSIKPCKYDAPRPDDQALALAGTLTDQELAHLCIGAFVGEGSQSVIGNSAISVAGAAGESTSLLRDRGVPNLVMADGPAGLRLSQQYGVDEQGVFTVDQKKTENDLELIPEAMLRQLLAAYPNVVKPERKGQIYEQNCTAIPVGTALAQSWNPSLCNVFGDLVGQEMERFGVHLWLAPAMNIQRNPLCGRNFEYYSEDPLLSGRMAAGITQGVQKHAGRGVTIKHFLCNNQETNRFYSNSQVSQRALRDIYARGFEIAIKEAAPLALMSSYNLLNGKHTSQRQDLMETLLREEWGYQGIVMSDFISGDTIIPPEVNKYPKVCASGSIAAGNDLMMPGGKAHLENILNALNNENAVYPLTRTNLEKCAARMIAIAWQLGGKP